VLPVHDEHNGFEFMILEGAQAGLSWDTILKKRARYQEVLTDLTYQSGTLRQKKVRELLRDAGICSQPAQDRRDDCECAGDF